MDMTPTRRMLARRESALTSDVARLANDLQRAAAGKMTRTEALKEAERIQRKLGTGWVLLTPDVSGH